MLMLVGALAGCSGDNDAASYTISITTSGSLVPYSYAGSYQFFLGGERVTRDLSSDGAYSVNFDADALVFVRVHGNAPASFYSLSITRDGEMIYESAAVEANQPLIHYPPPLMSGN